MVLFLSIIVFILGVVIIVILVIGIVITVVTISGAQKSGRTSRDLPGFALKFTQVFMECRGLLAPFGAEGFEWLKGGHPEFGKTGIELSDSTRGTLAGGRLTDAVGPRSVLLSCGRGLRSIEIMAPNPYNIRPFIDYHYRLHFPIYYITIMLCPCSLVAGNASGLRILLQTWHV